MTGRQRSLQAAWDRVAVGEGGALETRLGGRKGKKQTHKVPVDYFPTWLEEAGTACSDPPNPSITVTQAEVV